MPARPKATASPPPPPTSPTAGTRSRTVRPTRSSRCRPHSTCRPTGVVPVFTLWSPNPFTEDKFIEAVELRPGSVAAVHHSDVTARTLPAGTALGRGPAWSGGPLVDFVPMYPDGRSYNEVDSGASADASRRRREPRSARRSVSHDRRQPAAVLRAGRRLSTVPAGRGQAHQRRQRARVGTALHADRQAREAIATASGCGLRRRPHTHEVITKRIGEAHIIEGREFVAGSGGSDFPTIPPFADDWRITAITPFQEDVTLYGLWPHMHLRGKDMTFIATYPDGREEVLLHVPKYDFRWQLQYQLVTPVHLPAGSTIKAIGHYDNSARNTNNPAPERRSYGGRSRAADEMFNGWMELSVDRHVIALQRGLHDRDARQ